MMRSFVLTTFQALAYLTLATGNIEAQLDCPPMPDKVTQVNHDVRTDVGLAVGSLGKLKAGQLGARIDVTTNNLFEKYPNTDRILIAQMMSATYCEMIRDSKTLKEADKRHLWSEFTDRVFAFDNSAYKANAPQTMKSTPNGSSDKTKPGTPLQPEKTSCQLAVEWHERAGAVLPAEGRVSVLGLSENGRGGLAEFFGRPGGDFVGMGMDGAPRVVQEYRITNYCAKTVFNVRVSLSVMFKEVIERKDKPNTFQPGVITERTLEIVIPKIDPGPANNFLFYAMNNSRSFASVSFPHSATAQIAGTNSREQVQLIIPETGVMDIPPVI